jgi:hypothetical protein
MSLHAAADRQVCSALLLTSTVPYSVAVETAMSGSGFLIEDAKRPAGLETDRLPEAVIAVLITRV